MGRSMREVGVALGEWGLRGAAIEGLTRGLARVVSR